ncbi:LysR family transcriptional regulator [Advenella mimigardefordensis]|nr:LysR family transcriptional regulator [Advenella mimigardefordensis]
MSVSTVNWGSELHYTNCLSHRKDTYFNWDTSIFFMLQITFRQLEAFYWAGTLGTVAAAAKHLCISQPAVTARIKELETNLGLVLLLRSQQGVQLTPSGHAFLLRAQYMLQLGEEFEAGGRNEQPPLDGVLRLGADESSAAVGIAEILWQLRMRYPTLRMDLSIDQSSVLNGKLNRRELDITIQTSVLNRPHISNRVLGQVAVAWIAGASMDLADLPFRPDDAASVPLVINPHHSVLHSLARDWLGEARADQYQLNTCNSLAMIMKMVQKGHAMAVLPVPIVLEQLKQGQMKLVPADPPLPVISYYACFLSEKEAAGVGTIVDMASEILTECQFFISSE